MDSKDSSIALAALFSVHGYDHLFQLALPVALLISPFSILEKAILLNVMFFAFGFGSLPGGWLADRYDSRWVISIFLVFTGIGAIATAFSPDFTTTLIAQLLVGLGGSLYHP
ncbi:MAG: MFS transporter, partial [Candidatus Ranarchaeia archaeon]